MQTVLIDDDATTVFLTQRLFERVGLEQTLITFLSPIEAVAFLREQTLLGGVPLVVLLDLNMPLMSGWDVLEALKPVESQLLGQCVVYILTSSLAPADTARANEYPLVAGLLHKPLTQGQIHAIQAQVPGKQPE